MKNKNISRLLLGFMVSIFALAGCYEDKGHYNYSEITEVQTIGGISSVYNVTKGTTLLNIVPVIKTDKNGDPFVETDYNYEWRVMYQDKVNNKAYTVICDEKNMVDIDPSMLPAGEHTTYLTVTHKVTGVSWDSQNFTIKVVVPGNYPTGMLILVKEDSYIEGDLNEGTVLEFYSTNSDGRYVKSTIDLTTLPEGAMKNPAGVYCHRDQQSPTWNHEAKFAVILSSDTESYRLNPYTMSYNGNNLISQIFPNATNFRMLDIQSSDPSSIIYYVDGGRMYKYTSVGAVRLPNFNEPDSRILQKDGTYYNCYFTPRTSTSKYANPIVGIFYDEIGKVVYTHGYATDAELTPLQRPDDSEVEFLYNLSDTTLYVEQMLNATNVASVTSALAHMVVKNTDDPNYCQVWVFDAQNKGKQLGIYDLSNIEDIANAKTFLKFFSTAANYYYYATDSKIYSYRKLNTDENPVVDEVYSAPAGYIIEDLYTTSHGDFWYNQLFITLKPVGKPGWRIEVWGVNRDEGTLYPYMDSGRPKRQRVFESSTSTLIDFALKGR